MNFTGFNKFKNYIFYIGIALISFIFTTGLTFSDINYWINCTAKYGKCALHSGITFPDVDLWTRLAVGSIFFQTGQVLKKDIFSYVPTNPLCIDHEWGSGVVFYSIAKYFGYTGLFFLKAILIFLIFFLISKIIKLHIKNNEDKSLELTFFLLAAYSIFMIIGTVVRAQLFTYLIFTLWLYLLEKVRNDKQFENKLLWIFPITMLLWVNLHGGFLAGFGLLLIYALSEFLNKKNYLNYLKIFALCIPVTFINPYSIDFWRLFFKQAMTTNSTLISDWEPFDLFGPFYLYPGFRILIFITFIVLVKLILIDKKFDWLKAIMLIVTFILTLKFKRHMVFFVICATSLMYIDYISFFKSIIEIIRKNYGEKVTKALIIIKKSAVFLFISIFSILSINQFSSNELVSPIKYPVGSLEFIKQNNLKGNLSINYDWGSYALWKLYPQNLVSLDGRYEQVYSKEIYDKVSNLFERNNKTQMDYFHTDVILASKYLYELNDLMKLTGWRIVYEDPVSFVLVPKDKVKKNYIFPNQQNVMMWHEDLSKDVNLANLHLK